jgi:uncharacterized protein (DUF885 family)
VTPSSNHEPCETCAAARILNLSPTIRPRICVLNFFLLQFHTGTSISAEQVHAIGLAEVERISARIQNECMREMGFLHGQQTEFADFMRTEKRFYRQSSEELLQHYKGVLARIIDLLPAFFAEQPKCPLEIVARSDGPSAFYMAGTADGKRPGRFYVNVSHCDQRSVCDAVALALHEGVPGHHMQVIYQPSPAPSRALSRVAPARS